MELVFKRYCRGKHKQRWGKGGGWVGMIPYLNAFTEHDSLWRK